MSLLDWTLLGGLLAAAMLLAVALLDLRVTRAETRRQQVQIAELTNLLGRGAIEIRRSSAAMSITVPSCLYGTPGPRRDNSGPRGPPVPHLPTPREPPDREEPR